MFNPDGDLLLITHLRLTGGARVTKRAAAAANLAMADVSDYTRLHYLIANVYLVETVGVKGVSLKQYRKNEN